MKALHAIVWLLVIVGGLNWGLVGLGGLIAGSPDSWNLVSLLVGSWPALESIVYVLVGLSAVWMVIKYKDEFGSNSSM
jgi:uncharacterized membrane protein YuzA (DUF378 family)